jgi:PAS domain S-box-containing protein
MGQNSNTLGDPMGSSALGMAQSELILGSIRDAVVMTDLSGIVTYWNAAATKLFGWSADEVLGRHYAERYPAERREWISAQIIERVNGSDWDGEYADLRKDGSVVWIRALVRRIFGPDGKLAGILGVSQDISQEKQAQRTAQAQAALERAVLDSMPAHIAVHDPRGESSLARVCRPERSAGLRDHAAYRHRGQLPGSDAAL